MALLIQLQRGNTAVCFSTFLMTSCDTRGILEMSLSSATPLLEIAKNGFSVVVSIIPKGFSDLKMETNCRKK